ncbi:mandelate racemase/muconate lactonizing enzyme family protein [Kitasatospora kifunensis]|uniref:L-alanine-DL-glutamate epimerase-like enolase superfamily enzyme n=1 Tax=Kitasatospora kifunensis TaxID=58351 RepID=A0A7W7R9I2_KITKI|nr:enolase C-terminal domain-like protein [Kitasatospora kifunensis]MBB4927710.1 L-alanine-DL-glutamate epimerase-like enolase superfamily enzyme [Kitasatospora kifunensis]
MAEARLYQVALPMRYGFDHPAARRSRSDSLLLRLTVDGVSGLGECAPRAYVTGETTASVRAELQRVAMRVLLERLRTEDPAELAAQLRQDGFARTFQVRGGNNLLCLLETAVLDLLGRRLELSAGALVCPEANGGGTLPISQVLDLGITVEEFLATRGPFHFVKVKASNDLDRDVRTVRALRAELGPDVPISMDANMSWTPEQALTALRRLSACGLSLVEEPLPKGSWAELAELRCQVGVPVMLDESVCTLADAQAAVRAGACDAVNVRVAKCGGLLNSVRLVDFAHQHGLDFQVGVQVAETGPLIAAGRHLAFGRPGALTVESGQSDRYFPEPVAAPLPPVDRRANTISPPGGTGFAMTLQDSAEPWAVLRLQAGTDTWLPAAAAPKAEI